MNKEFLNVKKNDFLSLLRGTDLQDLLVQIENYFLEYRYQLNLPKNLTIGVELEYEGLSKNRVSSFIQKKLPDWISKGDGSLTNGGEIISPVMIDYKKYWEELKLVCDYLTKERVDTLHNAGGHIHIGSHILGRDVIAWKHFLKLYTIYEHVLFRFSYGDKINGRKSIGRYASPIAGKIYNKVQSWDDKMTIPDLLLFFFRFDRYNALNFKNVELYNLKAYKNTLEFRFPNASANALVWQNNINAFSKMLLSAQKRVLDEEFLDYKLKHEFHYNECEYSIICLKDALEFVDLTFDNNLDKIYFLRQYLKNFQESNGVQETIPAKKFVK